MKPFRMVFVYALQRIYSESPGVLAMSAYM